MTVFQIGFKDRGAQLPEKEHFSMITKLKHVKRAQIELKIWVYYIICCYFGFYQVELICFCYFKTRSTKRAFVFPLKLVVFFQLFVFHEYKGQRGAASFYFGLAGTDIHIYNKWLSWLWQKSKQKYTMYENETYIQHTFSQKLGITAGHPWSGVLILTFVSCQQNITCVCIGNGNCNIKIYYRSYLNMSI